VTDSAVRADPPLAGKTPARGGRVLLALVTIYLVWGGTFSGTKIALESIPPLMLTSSRFIVAAVLLLAVARLAGRRVRLVAAEWRATAWAGLVLVGVGSSLLGLGQVHVDSGLASLIVASVPLWTLVLGAAMGHRPTRGAVSGVILGLAGLVLLVGTSLTGPSSVVGIGLLVGSTLAWAGGSLLCQRMRLPTDTLVSAGWQMLAGGVAVAGVAVAAGEVSVTVATGLTTRAMLAWVVLAVVGTTIGYSTYGWLLQNASLPLATTYAYVNPVVAVAIGVALLGERLTAAQVPGALLVVGAVALVIAAERRVAQPAMAVPGPGLGACATVGPVGPSLREEPRP
jgi:drug/metabolite transporter (DMT)-like permease